MASSFLEGLQDGSQIAALFQGIPQARQREDLIKTQLLNAISRKQLENLNDPTSALIRSIQDNLALKSVDPTSGVSPALPGLESEVISTPKALTPDQQLALEAGGPQPTVQPGTPINPLMVAGKPTGFTQDLDSAIQNTQALTKAKGSNALEIALMRNLQTEADRASREKIATESNITKKEIATAKGGPKGMTPNAQATLLGRYGKVKDLVGDINDFTSPEGTIDFFKLATQVGSAERTQDLADLKAKEQNLPAAIKSEVGNYIASQKDLANLKSQILKIDETSGEPGALQNALAVVASEPSTGFFSSLIRQVANSSLTEDTKKKEGLRSALESAVTKSLSGASVTTSEANRLTGLLPKSDDTIKDLLRKSADLEVFLNNKISGLMEGSRLTPNSAPPVTTPDKETAPKAKKGFKVLSSE